MIRYKYWNENRKDNLFSTNVIPKALEDIPKRPGDDPKALEDDPKHFEDDLRGLKETLAHLA
jgi:hypothetical protein